MLIVVATAAAYENAAIFIDTCPLGPSNDFDFCCRSMMHPRGASCKASATQPAAYAVSRNSGLGRIPDALLRAQQLPQLLVQPGSVVGVSTATGQMPPDAGDDP